MPKALTSSGKKTSVEKSDASCAMPFMLVFARMLRRRCGLAASPGDGASGVMSAAAMRYSPGVGGWQTTHSSMVRLERSHW